MKKLLILLLFTTTLVFSQEERTINLGDFTTIKTYRGLKVELAKTEESPKIVIEGEKSKYVNIKNSSGVLKISLDVMETFSANDLSIIIYFNNHLDHLSANEGSEIFSDEKIKFEKTYLKASEAGEINLDIECSFLEVKAFTGGIVKLEGFSKNQDVTANTGGFYKGSDLKTEYTNVNAYTGGDATIYATDLVDANASVGGIIKVKGEPKKLNKKESLGGYVRN